MAEGEKDTGLVSLGFLAHVRSTYKVLFDPQSKTWYVENLSKLRPVRYAVFQGDIEVEWVRDGLMHQRFVVVRAGGRTIYGPCTDSVIDVFRRVVPGAINAYFIDPLLRTLMGRARERDGYLHSGFYAEGFVEGVKPYPALTWECKPKALEDAAKFITEVYTPANRAVALANAALAIAKVLSPGVRFAVEGRVFKDHIVVNTPDVWPEQKLLFSSIINLLGLDPMQVHYGWNDMQATHRNFLNMLMDSTAPLFLDDTDKRGLRLLIRYGPEAAFADHSIHTKEGKCRGCVLYFYNLRSMMVNTLFEPREIERMLARQYKNDTDFVWALDRMLILRWEPESMKREDAYAGGAILGCLREVWEDQGFRKAVLEWVGSDVDLAKAVLGAMRRRYGVDTRPYAEALDIAIRSAESYAEELTAYHARETYVILRMYEIARQVLGAAAGLTAYQVLKALVESPDAFGVRITGNKKHYVIEEELDDWANLARSFGFKPEALMGIPPSDARFESLSDVEKAFAFAWWLIASGKNRVFIHTRSPVYPGSARRLFGVLLDDYKGRAGYRVPLVVLLHRLLNGA